MPAKKTLLILSGKGGTGKTTCAAAFIKFSQADAFADCDVDAPNLHLVSKFSNPPTTENFYGGQKAFIDPKRCIKCGKCSDVCKFDAVISNSDGQFEIRAPFCEGCKVCTLTCPVGAIELRDDVAGEYSLFCEGGKVFSSAQLKMGSGNTGKLVSGVKKRMEDNTDCEFAIIDGSPGVGCPVMASLAGVSAVLAVAEPTDSGFYDLKRIIKLAKSLFVPIAVCVNKYDTDEETTDKIQKFSEDEGIPFFGKIPYDATASKAINEGRSIADYDCPAKNALFEIYNRARAFTEGTK